MMIAISGSAGTGKTTLAEKLSRMLDVKLIKKQVRDIIKYKYNNKIPNDTKYFLDFENEILKRKIDLEIEYSNNFISDRSTADILAYSLLKLNKDYPIETEILKQKCLNWLNVYDVIFFLPYGSIPLVADGIRSPNQTYQYMVSMLIYGILVNHCPEKIYVLNSKSLNERCNECLRYIKYVYKFK